MNNSIILSSKTDDFSCAFHFLISGAQNFVTIIAKEVIGETTLSSFTKIVSTKVELIQTVELLGQCPEYDTIVYELEKMDLNFSQN
jgi:hypothetical protein